MIQGDYINQNKMNCYKCKYFYVTWDRNFPKGCRFFGFMTYKIPSVYVLESSGEICHGFTPKY